MSANLPECFCEASARTDSSSRSLRAARIRRMMRRKLLAAALLALLIISPARPSVAQKRPLTESDLLTLLAGGVYCGRVTMLVRERGITFSATKRDLEVLRRAGADEELRRAVATAHRIATGISSSTARGRQLSTQALPNHTVAASHPAVVRREPAWSPSLRTSKLVPLVSVTLPTPQSVVPSGEQDDAAGQSEFSLLTKSRGSCRTG